MKKIKTNDFYEVIISHKDSTLKEFLNNLDPNSDLYLATYSVANNEDAETIKKIFEVAKNKRVYLIMSKLLFREREEDKKRRIEFFGNLFIKNMNIRVYSLPNLHAKVYLQDHICYMGSENFSQYNRNIEAGIIIRDKHLISELKKHFFESLLEEALPIEFDKGYMLKLLKEVRQDLIKLLGVQPDGSVVTQNSYEDSDFDVIEKCSSKIELIYGAADYFNLDVTDLDEAFVDIENLIFERERYVGIYEPGQLYVNHYSDKELFDEIFILLQYILEEINRFIEKNKLDV